jgi:hypothetical protein
VSLDAHEERREESTVLAYDFPLLSVFWSMFWFLMLATVFFAVVYSFIDNFRRSDHSGWAKAVWAFLIIMLPLFGTMIYIIARPATVE